MRISRAGLAVVAAILIPIVVEIRTVLVHVDVEISVAETALLWAVLVGLVLGWAMLPETNGGGGGGRPDTN
jgi:hypothetical protein